MKQLVVRNKPKKQLVVRRKEKVFTALPERGKWYKVRRGKHRGKSVYVQRRGFSGVMVLSETGEEMYLWNEDVYETNRCAAKTNAQHCSV